MRLMQRAEGFATLMAAMKSGALKLTLAFFIAGAPLPANFASAESERSTAGKLADCFDLFDRLNEEIEDSVQLLNYWEKFSCWTHEQNNPNWSKPASTRCPMLTPAEQKEMNLLGATVGMKLIFVNRMTCRSAVKSLRNSMYKDKR